MKKAYKQEMELRAGFAANLLAEEHSWTRVTEEYELKEDKPEGLELRQWN